MAHYHSSSVRAASAYTLSTGSSMDEDSGSDLVLEDSEPERETVSDLSSRIPSRATPAHPLVARTHTLPSATRTRPPVPADVIVLSSDDEDDNSASRMRATLLSFKHKTTAPAKSTFLAPAPPVFRASSVTSGPPAPSREGSVATADSWHLSPEELQQIQICVGCSIKWTARKSAANKLSHMRTCTRKLGVTPDTVRLLVEKQLRSATSTKQPRKTPTSTRAPTGTYFESIVNEPVRRQAGPRRKAEPTVKPVDKARDGILARAQGILAGQPPQTDPSLFTNNPNERIPSAQTILTSYLAGASGSSPSRFGSSNSRLVADSDSEDELPPSTQAMPQSRLAGSSRLGGATPSRPRNPFSPASMPNDPFVRTRSPAPTVITLSDSSADEPEMVANDGWMSDNSAILEGGADVSPAETWDFPSSSRAGPSRLLSRPAPSPLASMPSFATTTTRKAKSTAPLPPSDTESFSPAQPRARKTNAIAPLRPEPPETPSPTKPKSKRTPKPKTPKAIPPEFDMDAVMPALIKADTELYLRILRYEVLDILGSFNSPAHFKLQPVHLDVFARLALNNGAETRTLFVKLRAFLDQQGINFHTNDSTAVRSRRRRR